MSKEVKYPNKKMNTIKLKDKGTEKTEHQKGLESIAVDPKKPFIPGFPQKKQSQILIDHAGIASVVFSLEPFNWTEKLILCLEVI